MLVVFDWVRIEGTVPDVLREFELGIMGIDAVGMVLGPVVITLDPGGMGPVTVETMVPLVIVVITVGGVDIVSIVDVIEFERVGPVVPLPGVVPVLLDPGLAVVSSVDVDVGVTGGGAVVDVVVVVAGGVTHTAILTSLVSKTTAPVRAIKEPAFEAPVVSVTLARAIMSPAKVVPVPNVAELPTTQRTLHACASFTKLTNETEPVVRVEPVLKTNTASGMPSASRVSSPVRKAEVSKQ
jgi:hypothetical protein